MSELRLKRFEAARPRFVGLKDAEGSLSEAAALGEAEAAQGLGDYGAAVKIYERLLREKAVDEPAIWLSLATAAAADGDRAPCGRSVLQLYYEFPLSEFAPQAEGPLADDARSAADRGRQHALQARAGPRRAVVRISALSDARASFLRVKPYAKGDDASSWPCGWPRSTILGSLSNARARRSSRISTGCAAGRSAILLPDVAARAEELRLVRAARRARCRAIFPTRTWAEEALNNLATYYIQQDEMTRPMRVLREHVRALPTRPIRRARGLEGRLDCVSRRQHGGRGRVFRDGAPPISALGLSSGLAVLGRARARARWAIAVAAVVALAARRSPTT